MCQSIGASGELLERHEVKVVECVVYGNVGPIDCRGDWIASGREDWVGGFVVEEVLPSREEELFGNGVDSLFKIVEVFG